MINVNEYVKKFRQLNHRYYQSMKTIQEDIEFFKELVRLGKEEEAMFFYTFCVDAYGKPPLTDWGVSRRTAVRKDIYSATQQQMMNGGEDE